MGEDMHTNAPQTRIVIFAKAPIPGFCKTRLIGALGAEGAALLAEQMLLRTIQLAKQANIGPVELCVSPDPAHVRWHSIAQLERLTQTVEWSRQSEGDLGARMAIAVQRALALNQNVICIGTDCLELEVKHLQAAAAELAVHPVAIAPALDGGYVLLGLREFDASLFQDITWSTSTVCAETLARIHKLGWTAAQLATLRDIDEPEDLAFLPEAFKATLQENVVKGDFV